MKVIHCVITQKNSLRVDDRRDIKSIAVDSTWWNLTKTDNTIAQYTVSEFNVRIIGTEDV